MRLIVFLFITVLFFSCQKEQILTLTNPSDFDRIDETIILDKSFFSQSYDFSDNQAPVLKLNGELIPSQADDMNGDGYWDEFVFTLDLQAKASKKLNIEFVLKDEYPTFLKRTNLRLGIKKGEHEFEEVDHYIAPVGLDGFPTIAQGESVNWENDKMGFRNYFDCRNVKDLFGKLQPAMIVDKIHTPEMGDYHKLADWGMDVLHCGSSLGAGGLAMYENDSLFRLGSTDVYEYQKITEGPVRSVFDLKYKGWNVDGKKLDAVERISIYPGKYWFQSDVTVSGFEGKKQLATGIVTSHLKNDPYEFYAGESFKVLATLDKQSLNNDELGMAVMIPSNEMVKIGRTTNINFYQRGYQTVPSKNFSHVISETAYIVQKIENDQPARHYFFSVWGLENEKWKNIDNLKKYMELEANKLENPVSFVINY